MKKLIAVIAAAFALTGCAVQKMEPICEASVKMAGGEYSVSVYDVRKVGKQTQYRAGYPFNFQYVNKANFTKSTCEW